MAIRKDIIGNIPQIGDIIAFNPPRYKGTLHGECIGFSKVGLPQVKCVSNGPGFEFELYSPKTGFAVIKKPEENGY